MRNRNDAALPLLISNTSVTAGPSGKNVVAVSEHTFTAS
jgi:hypothetical protein